MSPRTGALVRRSALVLAVFAAAVACSQRFQRELDREIRRIYRPPVSSSCASDAQRLCSAAGHGGGQSATCLYQHRDQLSEECREVVDARERARTACKSELVKYCKETGDRPMLRPGCLARNRANLSSSCQDALDDAQL